MDGTAAPAQRSLPPVRTTFIRPTPAAPAARSDRRGYLTPGGTISATNVQNALTELDSEKASLASPDIYWKPDCADPD